jgi:hypothetical protein
MLEVDFKLPYYLILKLTLTPILTHVLATVILERFFVFQTVVYFFFSLFGLFVYEFTAYDLKANNANYTLQAQVIGGLRFILPSIFTFSTEVDGSVLYFQWAPHIYILLSSICNALIPILSKQFLIQHAHGLKLLEYQ